MLSFELHYFVIFSSLWRGWIVNFCYKQICGTSFNMSVIKCNPFLLSLIIHFLLYPNLIKGNLFRQIFKEGNFWTPKMQKNLTAHTLIECGSYCIADEVMMSRIGLLILKWFCIISWFFNLSQSEFFVLNKTEKNCYYGKLDETSDLLNLSMSSTIDPEKAYTLYLNLDYWEKASGKNMKLTEIKPTKPGKLSWNTPLWNWVVWWYLGNILGKKLKLLSMWTILFLPA